MGVLLGGYGLPPSDRRSGGSQVTHFRCRWVLKSWNDEAQGWPYSASVQGKAFYENVTPSLNMLIVGPVAYAGELTGEDEFFRVAERGFSAIVKSSPPSNGKSVAQKMFRRPQT